MLMGSLCELQYGVSISPCCEYQLVPYSSPSGSCRVSHGSMDKIKLGLVGLHSAIKDGIKVGHGYHLRHS